VIEAIDDLNRRLFGAGKHRDKGIPLLARAIEP